MLYLIYVSYSMCLPLVLAVFAILVKKSVIAKGKRAKVSVFLGSKMKTASGLKKSDLKK